VLSEAFEREVREVSVAASPGLDWATVAMRIGLKFPWEFDYRYNIRAINDLASRTANSAGSSSWTQLVGWHR